jgi:hypothetical protein
MGQENKVKKCPGCLEIKEHSLFHKTTKRSDGLSFFCKQCKSKKDKEYRDKNSQKLLAQKKEYYKRNKERMDEQGRLNYQKKKDEYKQRARKWKLENRARHNELCMQRHVSKLKAIPSWLSSIQKARIHEFYEVSLAIGMQTGIKQHVDHIIPLKSPIVCGLHVDWNLQILSASENCSKSNRI